MKKVCEHNGLMQNDKFVSVTIKNGKKNNYEINVPNFNKIGF